MDDEAINKVIDKLNNAQSILTEDLPPDMEVTEFNKSPLGRAVRLIEEAKEMLTDD
jgi:hypothetical protein